MINKEIKVKIVYFTTESKNTLHFVNNLNFESIRINESENLIVKSPYVLIFPTYGGGKIKGSVPKPVIDFLSEKENQKNIIGIVGSGDRNYGEMFCIGAKLLAKKIQVPLLYTYEIRGTKSDIEKVNLGISDIEKKINKHIGE